MSQPPQYFVNKRGSVFTFMHITQENVMKDIKDLDLSKASQENAISTKIIKENAIFSNFM